jgi:hypothetical protein
MHKKCQVKTPEHIQASKPAPMKQTTQEAKITPMQEILEQNKIHL